MPRQGALASIPTSVLSDIAAGKASGKKTYVRNAVIGCLGGEIGGGGRTAGTWGLVVLALYGLAVVTVEAYPFEKIKSLGRSAEW